MSSHSQGRSNLARKFLSRLFLVSLFLFFLTPLSAQQGARLPNAKDVVKPKVYVSLAPVPRGKIFEIAVVAEILPGFHVNSNKPSEDYLIATELKPELPTGFKVLSSTYPPGQMKSFQFAKKKLSVYEGTVTLRMKLQAPADASLGATKLPIILRYQACNDSTCLPPVRLPVPLEIEIAAANVPARPANPAIFKQ
jgi:hypothetical protein